MKPGFEPWLTSVLSTTFYARPPSMLDVLLPKPTVEEINAPISKTIYRQDEMEKGVCRAG